MNTHSFSNHISELGESPVWDDSKQCLWWVDISGHQIIRQYWGQKTECFPTTKRPSALGIVDADTLIVAFEDGLYKWTAHSNTRTLIARLNERPQNRTNDGKIGPDGRFWFGTMDDKEQTTTGALYSIDGDSNLKCHLQGIGISNTFAWSPCQNWMYFGDSMVQNIFRFPFQKGELGAPDIFVDLSNTSYYPDGSCIDSAGCLWNAQWDGSRIVRYSPKGEALEIIKLPVSRPTSCCFGGPKGKHLFITTAREDGDQISFSTIDKSGTVLMIETQYQGLPNYKWKEFK